jgi:hypothetical protein
LGALICHIAALAALLRLFVAVCDSGAELLIDSGGVPPRLPAYATLTAAYAQPMPA